MSEAAEKKVVITNVQGLEEASAPAVNFPPRYFNAGLFASMVRGVRRLFSPLPELTGRAPDTYEHDWSPRKRVRRRSKMRRRWSTHSRAYYFGLRDRHRRVKPGNERGVYQSELKKAGFNWG